MSLEQSRPSTEDGEPDSQRQIAFKDEEEEDEEEDSGCGTAVHSWEQLARRQGSTMATGGADVEVELDGDGGGEERAGEERAELTATIAVMIAYRLSLTSLA